MFPAVGSAAISPGAATQLAAHGVKLAPDEQNASVVIVGGQPGKTVTVGVAAPGCSSTACEATVASSVPINISPQPLTVIPLNRAAAQVTSVVDSTTATASAARLKTKPHPPIARAAVTVYGYNFGDQFCSNLGCTAWHFNMGSTIYYEGSYAWGTRSRYGYAGSITCTGGGVGYSVDQQVCQDYNDPSPTAFYAAAQYHISAPWPTSISQDHYLHRHVDGGGSYWLVAN
jgi:hypothetical protein